MREITIGPNDGQQRLDRFLAKYLPKASGSYLQKMIRQKKIKRNHKRTAPDVLIQAGDLLSFYIYEEVLEELEEDLPPAPSRVKLSILYEDDQICIIDKPPGLLSHAASARDYGHNVADALTHHLIEEGAYHPRQEHSFTPALANRLDFNTGGLLIGLKTHAAALSINRALQEGRIIKYYRAYCHGAYEGPERIEQRLKKEGQTMICHREGQEAITELKALVVRPRWSYLRIKLLTGRYHQIRAHLAGVGHPLVGDHRYGGGGEGFSHQLLLSSGLVFGPIEGLPELEGMEIHSHQLPSFDQLQAQVDQALTARSNKDKKGFGYER